MRFAWQRLIELHESKGELAEAAELLRRMVDVELRDEPANAARDLLRLSAVHAARDDVPAARQACEQAAAVMRAEKLQDPELEARLHRQRELLPERERGER